MSKIRFEYNEMQGNFHFEYLPNPLHEPNTHGWETIADETTEDDALRFEYILENLVAEFGGDDDVKFMLDTVRVLWYVFSNANTDLQSLINKAKELNPEKFA